MFGPRGPRYGALASAFLAVQRGETSKPAPATPLPHHVVCKVCGFDRWDGRTDHPRAGVRFARICTGVVPPDEALTAAQIEELTAGDPRDNGVAENGGVGGNRGEDE